MKIGIVYVYPTMGGAHDDLAARFVGSFTKHLPRSAHELYVVSNGGKPSLKMLETVKTVRCRWIEHDDSGWDIGAYRKAAREISCDLMVFFGGSAYLRRDGWFERVEQSFRKHGRAIYGATGSWSQNRHVRTTGFWLPPSLLNAYPLPTTSEQSSRYAFEHGPEGLTSWVLGQRLKAWVVTPDSEYEPHRWRDSRTFWWSNQENLLLSDGRTDQYDNGDLAARRTLQWYAWGESMKENT